MIFNLFNKRYDDWYTYIVEKEFPRIRYGHSNYSYLKFIKIICKWYEGAHHDNECGAEIPTGIKCRIIKSDRPSGGPLIELTCPKCKGLVEFPVDAVSMGEMIERENEKNNQPTKVTRVDAVNSGVYSKPLPRF